MKIIQIAGKKNTGKDTFAVELANRLYMHGYKVGIVHLADTLKDIVSLELGISLPYLENLKNTDMIVKGKTIRQWLQDRGEEITKKDQYYFIDMLQYKIDVLKLDYVIVADIRKPIEFSYFKSNGAVSIKITRPSLYIDNTSTDNHITETAIDKVPEDLFDYIFINNSIDELKSKAKVVSDILKDKYEANR